MELVKLVKLSGRANDVLKRRPMQRLLRRRPLRQPLSMHIEWLK
jgi:hypothetical protein